MYIYIEKERMRPLGMRERREDRKRRVAIATRCTVGQIYSSDYSN